MEDHKIYIHAFISACITIFIPMFVWGNIIAFLPWLVNKLNLLDSSLGFLFMLFAMMQIIVSQVSGRLIIPKIGSKKTQAIGMLIFSTCPFFFGLAYNNYSFILAAFPTGIALGLMLPTCTAITGLAEQKTKKILQPLYTSFISIGFLFGALSSGILQYFEFYPSYVICSLSLLALLGIVLIFYYGLPKDYEKFNKSEKFRFPEKKIMLFGLYGFIFMATVGIIGDWSALWFSRDLQTTALLASLAVTAWGTGESIGRLMGAKLITLTSQRFAGAYMGIIGCVVFFGCILTYNPYLILFGILFFAFCSANFYPIVIRYALSQTSENLNTTASNLVTMCMAGFLVGPAIVGYSASTLGLTFNVQILCFIWLFNSLALLSTTRKIIK
jgi:MFS family permease|tara:strand:- start:97 stop:1251 length:1155 start_codon:yes stop_codon:yes gene_type:complete